MFRNSILIPDTKWEPSVMELADPKREDVDKYIEFEEGSAQKRLMKESIFIIEHMLDDASRCLSYFAELPKEQRETDAIRQRQQNYRNLCVWLGEWRYRCVKAVKVVKFDPLNYSNDNVWKKIERWNEAYHQATGEHMPENWFVVQGFERFLSKEELAQFTNITGPYKDLSAMLEGVIKFFETGRLERPIR